MKSIYRTILICLLAFSLAAAQAPQEKNPYLKQAQITETKEAVQIQANSPRPLAQVLDALLQKYGWIIDYEDPQYTSEQDLKKSDLPGLDKVPAGGRFTVEFPAEKPDKEKVLQLILDAYNKSDNPGRFELRKFGPDGFAVVGTQARDAKGQVSRQQVLFDTPITIPVGKRSISETLNLICQKLAEQQKLPVTIGVVPSRLLDFTQVEAGGAQASARDFLFKSTSAASRRLYWRILFDPGSKGYFLDLHAIKASSAP